MNKANHTNDSVSISKGAFGTLAFLLGIIGIHDFAAKRYLCGCGHLALFIAAIVTHNVVIPNIVTYNNSFVYFLPIVLILGSWTWAVIESVHYQKKNSNVVAREEQIKKFTTMSIATEIITGLLILLVILAIAINIPGRNCYASGCDGAGFAVVFEVVIGAPIVFLDIFLIRTTLSQRKDYLIQYEQTKTISNHTAAIGILGIFLVTIILLAILITTRVI